jgi:hypothetical protein
MRDTALKLKAEIDAKYRDAVMLRGLAEAEYASLARGDRRETMRDIALVRHGMHLAIEQVRILEDARRDVAELIRTLEAL